MSTTVSGLFIRPPRAKYDRKSLGPKLQKLASWRGYPIIVRRQDFQIRNRRNLNLECSLYIPIGRKEKKKQTCIIYCHGASGGRLDGITDAWEIGMQLEASMCVFDFAGCGKSQGENITLGLWEEDDARCIFRELVSDQWGYTDIVLWGRSMGAVACVRLASNPPDKWIPPPPALSNKEYMTWEEADLVELLRELEDEQLEDEDEDDEEPSTLAPPMDKPPPPSPMTHTEDDDTEEQNMKQAGDTQQETSDADLESMPKEALIDRIQKLTQSLRAKEYANREQVKGLYMTRLRALILDSPFANLWNAAKHIIEHYKSVVPQFMLRGLASVGLPIVRKSILKQIPEFDIKNMEIVSLAKRCTTPALFLHGVSDSLIPWEESRQVYDAYGLGPSKKDQVSAPPPKPSEVEVTTKQGDLKHFKLSNRRASSPANPTSPLSLQSPKERAADSDLGGDGRVPRQYILVDGDHNSLRPASYYDAIAAFLARHMEAPSKETKSSKPSSRALDTAPTPDNTTVPAVVPDHIKETEQMRFFYGVAVISEYTDEEVKLEKSEDKKSEGDKESRSQSDLLGKPPHEDPMSPQKEVTLEDYVASGVSCTVRTVSFSWRMVLGLHPKRGILVFRPYSGISLYAVSFAELLSFHMASPAQLRFMFLDGQKTQRRVRFYSPEVPALKEQIDRSIRKLVTHDHMSTNELMEKIKSNLAGAASALVEKRLLSSRGLKNEEVVDIINSLSTAIKSMLSERNPDEVPRDLDPEKMVQEAVVKAVEDRTGWRPDLGTANKKKKRPGGGCILS